MPIVGVQFLLGTAAAADRVSGNLNLGHWRRHFVRSGPAAASARFGRCRRGLFGAHPLFPFPARANARNLIVSQQGQMAPNRNVHLAQQSKHLVSRDTELTRHVMHTKLAQPILLPRNARRVAYRGCPGYGATDTARQRLIYDSNRCRRLTSYGTAQLDRTWPLDHFDPSGP